MDWLSNGRRPCPNLPRPDRYATVQVHAFLAQLILYQGFYNAELEWVGVPKVQVAGSMNPSGGIGRYPLGSRPGPCLPGGRPLGREYGRPVPLIVQQKLLSGLKDEVIAAEH